MNAFQSARQTTGRLAIGAVALLTLCAVPALTQSTGRPVSQQGNGNLVNAAQARYGARFRLEGLTRDGSRDPQTQPESTFDGNVHSRCVLRGAPPYTFVIELVAPIPIQALRFADSDYASERAPKEIEISLDGGPGIRHTLELLRPVQRRPAWQEVAIGGKTARVIKVTVLSNYEPDPKVNWGGLAEIAILTPENLDTRFAVPAGAPAVFVHPPKIEQSAAPTRVQLPPVAPPGEHPRLLLTRAEVEQLKRDLANTDRGKAALKALLGVADGALKSPPAFPDPNGPPGQLKDRGDAVAQHHDRLALNAGALGMAYTLTGKKEYADGAAAILRGYAERYAAYPEHSGANKNDTGKVMGQRLSEAMWLIPLIESYDYIYSSGALTPDNLKQVENNLIRPAITFIRRKQPAQEAAERSQANPDWRTAAPKAGGAANWLLFYNAATMMAGASLGDKDMVDLAAADFRYLLANGIGSDGMWGEGAIGYQFFAISALIGGVETAARQGIDLWSFDNARFKRLFDSPLRYAYPDASAPGINDSGRAKLGNWSTMSYDYAYLRYGDPAYSYLVNASPRQVHPSEAIYFPTRVFGTLPEPAAITFPSTVFENLGYAILRSPEVYALVDYGPHGGVHGHPDKLNLILYAAGPDGKGDEMGGEPQFHRYEDPLHDEWTAQTVAHNTVTVDQVSQVASEGRLTLFEAAAPFQILRAETGTSVPGALLDRTIVLLPGAVLDLYHGQSGFERTWDQTLRFQGNLRDPIAISANPPSLGSTGGYQHMTLLGEPPSAESWTGVWDTKMGAFQAFVAPTPGATPGQKILLARGPDKDAMALVRQTGKTADFAVAYRLESWANPILSIKRLPLDTPDLMAVEVNQRDGTGTTVIVSYGQGAWKALGWESDARVLCIRRQGNQRDLMIAGGSFATSNTNGALRQPAAGNYVARWAAGKWDVTSNWAPSAP